MYTPTVSDLKVTLEKTWENFPHNKAVPSISVFLRGEPRPHKGAGPSVPIFGDPYLRPNSLT